MNKVTPFLWYNDNLEEAMNFYKSVFKNFKVMYENRQPDGSLFTGEYEIEGQRIMAINGGPHYELTPAISLFVKCKDQAEVDYFWDAFITNGGEESMCGWLVDKFGLSWQIIPDALGSYLGNPDPLKANKAMKAMLKMQKLIIKDLDDAVNN